MRIDDSMSCAATKRKESRNTEDSDIEIILIKVVLLACYYNLLKLYVCQSRDSMSESSVPLIFLVVQDIDPYSFFRFIIFKCASLFAFYSILA